MTAIRRIFWKEYRTQGSLFGSLLIGVLLLQLLPISTTFLAEGQVANVIGVAELLQLVAVVLTYLFTCTSACMLFAGESEESTDGWLRTLPVSTGQLKVGKIGFSLAAILLFAAGAAIITLLVATVAGVRLASFSSSYNGPGIVAVQLLSWLGYFLWGLFFSVTCRKVLSALAAASIAATLTPGVVNAVVNVSLGGAASPYESLLYYGLFALLFLVLWIVNDRAIRRWHLGRTVKLPSFRGKTVSKPRWSARLLELLNPRLTKLLQWSATRGTVATRTWGVLLWKELRTCISFGLLALLAGGVLVVLAHREAPRSPMNAVVIGIIVLLCGVKSFRDDQHNQAIGFLGHRGISPTPIYVTKVLVWGGLATGLAAILLWIDAVAVARLQGATLAWSSVPLTSLSDGVNAVATPAEWSVHSVAERSGRYWSLLSLLFLAMFLSGLAVSFWMRRTVLAVAAGLGLGIVLLFWSAATFVADVPPLAVAWPVMLALVAGVWFTRRAWMDGRTGWKLKVAQVLWIVVPLSCCFSYAMAARALQVPRIEPAGFHWKEQETRLAAFDQQWSTAWRNAYTDNAVAWPELAKEIRPERRLDPEMFSPLVDAKNSQFSVIGFTNRIQGDLDPIVTREPPVVRTGVQRSPPLADLSGGDGPTAPFGHERFWAVDTWTEIFSDFHATLGRVDSHQDQVDHLIAAVKILRYLQTQVLSWAEWSVCCQQEQAVLGSIRAFAADPSVDEPTLARLQSQLDEALGQNRTAVGAQEMLRSRYVIWRQSFELRGIGETLLSGSDEAPGPAIQLLTIAERQRCVSLMGHLTQRDLVPHAAGPSPEELQRWIATTPWLPLDFRQRTASNSQPAVAPGFVFEGGWYDRVFWDTYASELATVIIVGLQRHRLLHGKFPDRLEELLELGLGDIPRDPWTQSDFGYWPQGYPRSRTGELKHQPLLNAGFGLHMAEHMPAGDGKTLRLNPDRIRFQLGYEHGANTNWRWPKLEDARSAQ